MKSMTYQDKAIIEQAIALKEKYEFLLKENERLRSELNDETAMRLSLEKKISMRLSLEKKISELVISGRMNR